VRAALFVCLAAVFAAVSVSAAGATTPAAYRTKVNGICRSYTPKLKPYAVKMTKTQETHDLAAFTSAVRGLLTLGLQQDVKMEAVAVPRAMQARMKPILSVLEKSDVHVRAALKDIQNGNTNAMLSELLSIGSDSLDRQLDAAGLKDCGSNQTRALG
jgi:hypothetical protein